MNEQLSRFTKVKIAAMVFAYTVSWNVYNRHEVVIALLTGAILLCGGSVVESEGVYEVLIVSGFLIYSFMVGWFVARAAPRYNKVVDEVIKEKKRGRLK